MDEVPWTSMRIERKADGRTFIAKFDLADDELIRRYTWHIQKGVNTQYAEAMVVTTKKDRAQCTMHGLLLGPGRIDHLNGNGLDNRRANIRHATQSEILAKRGPGGGVSKYKGVAWDNHKYKKRWVARFRGKNLGRFEVEEDAARAFDDAAFEYWGHQAYFNFPDEVKDWIWTPPAPVDTE